jgi:hypothetical protein
MAARTTVAIAIIKRRPAPIAIEPALRFVIQALFGCLSDACRNATMVNMHHDQN